MEDRSALLICCSRKEVQEVRRRAEIDHRNLSTYVFLTVFRHISIDDQLFAQLDAIQPLHKVLNHRPIPRSVGPRATMLVRCSKEEANRIRGAAKRRATTISAFVVHALRSAWEAHDKIIARNESQSTNQRKPLGQFVPTQASPSPRPPR